MTTIYFDFNISYFSYWAFNPDNFEWMKRWYFGIFAALFGVDSFLFLSALLVAYKFSKQMAANAKRRPMGWRRECYFWFMYTFARWLRLMPVLLTVMLTAWFLVGKLSTSPGWPGWWNSSYVEPCNKYWWATLLFIQNLYPGGSSFGNKGDFCIGVSWYLAVDMQLYVFVAPAVLITFHYGLYLRPLQAMRRVFGWAALVACMLASIGATAYVVIEHDVMWQFLGVGDFQRYYITPWCRAPPYIMGLALGLLLHQLAEESPERLERMRARAKCWMLTLAWLVAFGVLLFLVFIPSIYISTPEGEMPPLAAETGAGMTPPQTQAYMILKYVLWGCCLFVLFGINSIGKGWFVNDILSAFVWAPIAKLTYGAYLLSILIQNVVTQSLITDPVYYNTWTTLSYWVSFICGAYFMSFLLFMCVEAPFGNLLKFAMKGLHGNAQREAEEKSASGEGDDAKSEGADGGREIFPENPSSAHIEIVQATAQSFLTSKTLNARNGSGGSP